METKPTLTWQQYEAGREFKRRIGLYETARKNERFYRGDQWQNEAPDLPHPVFNLVKRVVDYLVAAAMPTDLSIRYTDDHLPFLENEADRTCVLEGIRLLNRNADYRWKRSHMESLSYEALLDAAISGDGVFYCSWDHKTQSGQPFHGDVCTELINSTCLFAENMQTRNIQEQNYILLSGRAPVFALREEARENHLSKEEIASILPDGETEFNLDDLSEQNAEEGSRLATYLIKFFREDGTVILEKSVKNCVIKRVNTGLSLYPVAYFSWQPAKNSFHGSSPIDGMLANQKYINLAYAMAMKHMSDTAFSKVVYDKSRIPEWSNEVGEAIAALGGGNVSDAVSVVGVGQMQEGYLGLIESIISTTRAMMGATESALGDEYANNTSAILTLQEASRLALRQVSAEFQRCLGELASIWADMLCTYCPKERLLPMLDENGDLTAGKPDYKRLKGELLRATVQVRSASPYTPAATLNLLDKLLDGGHITVEDYLELLPADSVSDREAILKKIRKKENPIDE